MTLHIHHRSGSEREIVVKFSIGVFLSLFLFACIAFALHRSQTSQPQFGHRIDCGQVVKPELTEISGVAASRLNPGVLWVHNDSGDKNRIYAIDLHGDDLGTFTLAGARARDWEDIAVGPGPDAGVSYIYVGDIGDNDAVHKVVRVYRLPEPRVIRGEGPLIHTVEGVETLTFTYPDGPHDAETLLIDPLTRDLYIITKREERVTVFRAAYPQSSTRISVLEPVARLELGSVVAGDISATGDEILIKTYTAIYYWGRNPEQSLAAALGTKPLLLPYEFEPQGEAVCWSRDGAGYYTVSEERGGMQAHLYFYPRLAAGEITPAGSKR